MAQRFTLTTLATLGGTRFQTQTVVSDELALAITVPQVPKAQAGTLTTRTSNSVGTLTMASAAHGIVTGQRIDIYWLVSGAWLARYGVTVGTVAGTSVPFTGGAGTNLPAASTAVLVGIPQQVLCGVTGDNVSAALLIAPGGGPALFTFASAAPADVLAEPVQPGGSFTWYTGLSANPFAGLAIASVWISHGVVAAIDVSGGILTH